MYKRIVAALTIFGVLSSYITAFCNDEFTLHNGTKFGMTQQDVIALEEANGFPLETTDFADYILYGEGII